MLPEQKLDALLARHGRSKASWRRQVTPETYVKLSREFAELGPVVETVRNYRDVAAEIDDLEALIADSSTDAEMRDDGGSREAAARAKARRARAGDQARPAARRTRWTSAT